MPAEQRRARVIEVHDALHKMDGWELAMVAKSAVEQIRPDPTDGMDWRTYGETIRRELDRIEFESDARDQIQELIDKAKGWIDDAS